MSIDLYYAVLPLSTICIVAGSIWLDVGFDRLGTRSNLLPGILGLISALGADSPEISASISAMFAGRHDTSVGVMIGSNLFNLAGLLGFSAMIAGPLALRRSVTAFNGLVSLMATSIVVLLVLHVFSPELSTALLGALLLVYVLMLSIGADRVEHLALPAGVTDAIGDLLRLVHVHHSRNPNRSSAGSAQDGHSAARLAGIIGGSLLLIVMGSYGAVHASLRIGHHYDISDAIVGSLILAPLTGFPNVYTSARLALRGEGAAMVSETLNSNTINMVVGIGVPAMVFGVTQTPVGLFELWWLIGLTVFALALIIAGHAATRWMGAAIVAAYLGFVFMRVTLF